MATQEYLLRTLSFAQAERARVSANSHFICFNRLRSRIEKNYDPEAVIGADVPAQAIADTFALVRRCAWPHLQWPDEPRAYPTVTRVHTLESGLGVLVIASGRGGRYCDVAAALGKCPWSLPPDEMLPVAIVASGRYKAKEKGRVAEKRFYVGVGRRGRRPSLGPSSRGGGVDTGAHPQAA